VHWVVAPLPGPAVPLSLVFGLLARVRAAPKGSKVVVWCPDWSALVLSCLQGDAKVCLVGVGVRVHISKRMEKAVREKGNLCGAHTRIREDMVALTTFGLHLPLIYNILATLFFQTHSGYSSGLHSAVRILQCPRQARSSSCLLQSALVVPSTSPLSVRRDPQGPVGLLDLGDQRRPRPQIERSETGLRAVPLSSGRDDASRRSRRGCCGC